MTLLDRLHKIIFGKVAEHNYPVLLTLAYVIAFSMIAVFTVFSHIITNNISDAQLARAEIIYELRAQNASVLDISSHATGYYNDSMEYDYMLLSQSIEKLDQSYKIVADYLQKDAHIGLGKAWDTLNNYYYDDRFGVARKIEDYLETSRRFAEYDVTSVSPERKGTLAELNKGNDRILADLLNATQSDFQRDTIAEIQSIMNIQLYMAAGIILVIILEALFIFRPIILRLEKYHNMILSQALEDALTGLGNRRSFYKLAVGVLDTAKRENKPFAFVLCDLDKFKSVNDTYGHDVGDEVLKNFAKLLKSELRPSDVVCRLGGEEFAIIMPHTDARTAVPVLDRLIGSIRDNVCAYQLGNGESGSLKYTSSIGYTIGDPKNIVTIDAYLRDADTALYKAKNNGRDQYMKFTAESSNNDDSKKPAPNKQVKVPA